MTIVEHYCGQLLVRRDDGSYIRTADDDRTITHCPDCGQPLARGHMKKEGD